jgi:hypothetical protein
MHTFRYLIVLVSLVSFESFSMPVYERDGFASGIWSNIEKRDSCGRNRNGRKVFISNNNVGKKFSFIICRQVFGYTPTNSSYLLDGKLNAQSPPTEQYLGCTVNDDGISTGYSVLWYDLGGYLPSDITNAESTLIIANMHSGPKYLINNHQNKSIIFDYREKDGKIISNQTVSPAESFFLKSGSSVIRAKYSFPYSGGIVPCHDN